MSIGGMSMLPIASPMSLMMSGVARSKSNSGNRSPTDGTVGAKKPRSPPWSKNSRVAPAMSDAPMSSPKAASTAKSTKPPRASLGMVEVPSRNTSSITISSGSCPWMFPEIIDAAMSSASAPCATDSASSITCSLANPVASATSSITPCMASPPPPAASEAPAPLSPPSRAPSSTSPPCARVSAEPVAAPNRPLPTSPRPSEGPTPGTAAAARPRPTSRSRLPSLVTSHLRFVSACIWAMRSLCCSTASANV